MTLSSIGETLRLLRVARPNTIDGAERLARCHSIDDVARRARRRLPRGVQGYLESGSDGEYTLRRNRASFDELELVPDMPRDVSDVDLSTTILGQPAALPFGLAPVGGPRMLHHDGELAVARAAGRAGIPYGISTVANTSVEDVASQTETPLWFQLYVWGDRGEAREAILRAKAAGFSALLFTIDTQVRSKREREMRAGLGLPRPQLRARTVLDGALHPSWAWHFLTSETISFPNIGPADHRSREKIAHMFDGTVTWDDLDWIRDLWDGPIVVKGVLSPKEAIRAAEAGLAGVIVSNHGGRQLDHAPAAIDVLPGIADAVGDQIEVLVDSGFRRGTDIVTALALGANAVLLGRAYLYGLAAAGEAGVSHCLNLLAQEVRTTMALCGATSIVELDRRLVRRRYPAMPTYATRGA